METKWLQDSVSLVETRSFSRSAQLRHVTQPALSRRVQSLEACAGTDLVDRSSHPTRLNAAGEPGQPCYLLPYLGYAPGAYLGPLVDPNSNSRRRRSRAAHSPGL